MFHQHKPVFYKMSVFHQHKPAGTKMRQSLQNVEVGHYTRRKRPECNVNYLHERRVQVWSLAAVSCLSASWTHSFLFVLQVHRLHLCPIFLLFLCSLWPHRKHYVCRQACTCVCACTYGIDCVLCVCVYVCANLRNVASISMLLHALC